MKIISQLILIVLFSAMFSCKKERGNEAKYLIFTSDSSGVYGKILNDTQKGYIFSGQPCPVIEGQRILFDREYSTNANRFNITADIGKYNYFTPNNQYHYRLTNEYLIVVK